jgi:hypothetical protein
MSAAIEVSGDQSSGEAEFVLVQAGGALYVGAGSDHTDRAVETYSVAVSKQMCDKPVAHELWNRADVSGHWDRLLLRSWILGRGSPRSLPGGSSILNARAGRSH